MAFQEVPNSAEVSILYSQNSETLANVFHATLSTGYDFADIVDLAEAVDQSVVDNLRPEMTQDCNYLRTEVRGLDEENDLFATVDTGTGPGAIATAGLPNSVTLSIKKESGRTGRSARGRWYVVGIPLGNLSSNENSFLSAEVTQWVAAVDEVRQDVQATQWAPVIVSRFTGGVARDFGVTFPWISSVAVNVFVDTQRRRLTL